LIIAFITKPGGDIALDATETWRKDLNLNLLIDDYIGRTYIQIDVRDFEHIPRILQYALNQGLVVALHSSGIGNCYREYGTFIPSAFEEHLVQSAQDDGLYVDNDGEISAIQRFAASQYMLPGQWAWMTPAGKRFCQKLRRCSSKHWTVDELAACDDVNNVFSPALLKVMEKYRLYLRSPWWSEQVGSEQPSHSRPAAMIVEMKLNHAVLEPLQICAVCEDRPAATVVLPCSHVVVCQQCSHQLRNTADRAVCIRCRNPITMILSDGCEPEPVKLN
jgi:hypothetical protein